MPIRLTKTIKALLITYTAVFLFQHTADQFFGTRLLGLLGLVPDAFIHHYAFWQLFTYSFIHGDVMHLFFNMLMLAFVGGDLESLWGRAQFLKYYFFCIVASGLFYVLLQWTFFSGSSFTPMLGASGALYGLLMAYGLVFGERVLLFMMLFPMKAKHFVWVLGGLELMTTVYSSGGPWASVAHLGGMVAGFSYLWARAIWILAQKRRSGMPHGERSSRRRSKHLKLIVNNNGDFESPEEGPEGGQPRTWH